MQREQYKTAIKERILAMKPGAVVMPPDFKDIADREISKKALLRLCEEKTIRRVMRGIYEYPEFSNFLHEFVSPDPNRVADSLARNYGMKNAQNSTGQLRRSKSINPLIPVTRNPFLPILPAYIW